MFWFLNEMMKKVSPYKWQGKDGEKLSSKIYIASLSSFVRVSHLDGSQPLLQQIAFYEILRDIFLLETLLWHTIHKRSSICVIQRSPWSETEDSELYNAKAEVLLCPRSLLTSRGQDLNINYPPAPYIFLVFILQNSVVEHSENSWQYIVMVAVN